MRHIKITSYYKSPHQQGGDFGNQMMMRLLIKWLCLTAAILFTAYFLEGIRGDPYLRVYLGHRYYRADAGHLLYGRGEGQGEGGDGPHNL